MSIYYKWEQLKIQYSIMAQNLGLLKIDDSAIFIILSECCCRKIIYFSNIFFMFYILFLTLRSILLTSKIYLQYSLRTFPTFFQFTSNLKSFSFISRAIPRNKTNHYKCLSMYWVIVLKTNELRIFIFVKDK